MENHVFVGSFLKTPRKLACKGAAIFWMVQNGTNSIGRVAGSAIRTRSTTVVSSWQASPMKQPIESTVSGAELIALMKRRQTCEEMVAVIMTGWNRRWSKIGHRIDGSDVATGTKLG